MTIQIIKSDSEKVQNIYIFNKYFSLEICINQIFLKSNFVSTNMISEGSCNNWGLLLKIQLCYYNN